MIVLKLGLSLRCKKRKGIKLLANDGLFIYDVHKIKATFN